MSGIEVAGLVLAVIPLFISAAEHYRDGLDAVDKLWHKERVLQQYLEELETQQSYLIMGLQGLLADVDLDYTTKESLVGNVSAELDGSTLAYSEAWEQPHVRQKLEHKFRDGYKPFVFLMQRLTQTLLGQVRKHPHLPSDRKDTTPAACSNILYLFHQKVRKGASLPTKELWDRVKFTWRSPERNQMLQDIRRYNNDLLLLFQRVEASKPFHRAQRVYRANASFRVRDQAQRLHQVLSCHCHCKCNPGHEIKLCLRRAYGNCGSDDELRFETLLYHTPLRPCQATIKLVCNDVETQKNPKVRFQIETLGTSKARQEKQPTALNDVCTLIGRAHSDDVQLELIIDEQSKLWQAAVAKNTMTVDSLNAYTLDSMLSTFSQYSRKRWLAKEKAILAVILSHSLLHLHGSSWLSRDWRAEHITFLHTQKLVLDSAFRFRLEQPYVSAAIVVPPSHSRDPATTRSYDPSIPNLLALGIILLELHLNASLDTANATSMEEVQVTALKAQMKCSDEMESLYYEALKFCLYPSAPPPSGAGERSFEDAKFRDHYYRHVVVPLEENLSDRFEVTQKDLDSL